MSAEWVVEFITQGETASTTAGLADFETPVDWWSKFAPAGAVFVSNYLMDTSTGVTIPGTWTQKLDTRKASDVVGSGGGAATMQFWSNDGFKSTPIDNSQVANDFNSGLTILDDNGKVYGAQDLIAAGFTGINATSAATSTGSGSGTVVTLPAGPVAAPAQGMDTTTLVLIALAAWWLLK